MYNKSSQRAFQGLVAPATLPQKPLKIKSPDNSQNNSRRPSQINDSPSKDPDNALNFYLSLPKQSSSVTKAPRENKVQERNDYDNFTTEPARHSKENTPSPQKITKSGNKPIGQGVIFQNSKNKEQKGKGRGIDYVNQQASKESAYSTAIVSSPKVSPYNSVNTAQTHLIKTPNVNRNLVNQINQSIGTYLDNQNQDESYWETLDKKYSSPTHHQSIATEKYSHREAFPWETNEIFVSTRTTGKETAPQTGYNSARRLSKPEYVSSSRREKEQDELVQTVRSIIEKKKNDVFDLPLNVEPERKEQLVRSPGQVRKNTRTSEQKSNSGMLRDFGEELALTKRMNHSDKEKIRLMEELMSLQKELEEKDGEMQELQDEEKKQEKENKRMVDEINMIEQARKENEEEIRRLKEKSSVQVKDIKALKKCKDGLERQLKEFGGKAKEFKDCSNRVKKCREEVDKTNKQIMQMNKRLERIQLEESEAIEEEKKRTEEGLRRLEGEVTGRDQEIVELEKELKEVNEKREEYRLVAEKIKELEELQMELMEENDILRERLESFFKDQTNNYKQSQNKDLNIWELQEKEHKDMEEISSNLMKVKKRLEEIENYSKRIMKILEFSRQGKDIPIELILPHNRTTRTEKRGKVEEEIIPLKKMNNIELRNAVVENIKIADDIRKRLEQNVAGMLEGYLRRDRENNY